MPQKVSDQTDEQAIEMFVNMVVPENQPEKREWIREAARHFLQTTEGKKNEAVLKKAIDVLHAEVFLMHLKTQYASLANRTDEYKIAFWQGILWGWKNPRPDGIEPFERVLQQFIRKRGRDMENDRGW